MRTQLPFCIASICLTAAFSYHRNCFQHPVDQPQHPAGEQPIQDHRPGDGEDLTANAEDLSFCQGSIRDKKQSQLLTQ